MYGDPRSDEKKISNPCMFSSVEFKVPVNAYFFLLLKSVKIFESKSTSKSMTIVSIAIFYSYLVNIEVACLFVCLFVFSEKRY